MKKIVVLILLFSALINAKRVIAQQPIINTVAGNGVYGFTGYTIAATSAQIAYPEGLAVDDSGNLFIPVPDFNVVCKVNRQGIIFPIAGDGWQDYGFSGDGGPATAAILHNPIRAAVDDSDNVYFIDNGNNRIRKINTHGIITTVIGDSVYGFNGDSIADTLAEINLVTDLAIDKQNTIYFSDADNHRIRKINTNGIVVTIGGTGVLGDTGDGGPATAAELGAPENIAVDQYRAVYFADAQKIKKISSTGILSTIAGTGAPGYSGDGGPATDAQLHNPEGIAVDSSGNVYFLDAGNQRLRKIAVNGTISTAVGTGIQGYSGDGGPPSDAELNYASGVTIDQYGNMYIADLENNRIREIAVPTGIEQLSVNNEQLSVYPNPSNGVVTITSSKNIDEVTATNIFGQIIFKSHVSNTHSSTNSNPLSPFTFKLSNEGIYFVTIMNDNETTTRKVVVSK